MQDQYVLEQLRGRLAARVQGKQDTGGRWYLNLQKTFAYVPPTNPRSIFDLSPILSTFDMSIPVDIQVVISVEIEKYTMRYSFESVLRSLTDMLNRRYKELVGLKYPFSQENRFTANTLKDLLSQMSPWEHRNQLYGRFIINPADRANLENGERSLPHDFEGGRIGDLYGSPIFESPWVKRGEVFFQPHESAFDRGFRFDRPLSPEYENIRQKIGRRIDKLSERMFLHGHSGYSRYSTSYIVGEGSGEFTGSKLDIQKLRRSINKNWSQEWDEWRYRDDYEWNWVGRGLMWLKRKILSLKK